MLGTDMMIANLVGLKPSEMKAMAEKITNAVEQGARDLEEIKSTVTRLEETLSRLEALHDNGSNGNSNRNPKRRSGSRDSGATGIVL